MLKFFKKLIYFILFIFELFVSLFFLFLLLIYLFFKTGFFENLVNSYINKNLDEKVFNLSFKDIKVGIPFSINVNDVLFFKLNRDKSLNYLISIPSINFKFLFNNFRFFLVADSVFFSKKKNLEIDYNDETIGKNFLNYHETIEKILNASIFLKKVDIKFCEFCFDDKKITCGLSALIDESSKNYLNFFIKNEQFVGQFYGSNLKFVNGSLFSNLMIHVIDKNNQKIVDSSGNISFDGSQINFSSNFSFFDSKIKNINCQINFNSIEFFNFFIKKKKEKLVNIISGKFKYDLNQLENFSFLKNFESLFLNFSFDSNGMFNLNVFDKNNDFFKLDVKNENEKIFFDCKCSNKSVLKNNNKIFDEFSFSFCGSYFENDLKINKLFFDFNNNFFLKSEKEITYNFLNKSFSEFRLDNEFISIKSKNKNLLKYSDKDIPQIFIKFYPKIESTFSNFIFNDFFITASINKNGVSGTFENLESCKKKSNNFKKNIKINNINFFGDFLFDKNGIKIMNGKINTGKEKKFELNFFGEYNFFDSKININSIGKLSLDSINNIFEDNIIDGEIEHNIIINFFKNKLSLRGDLKLKNGIYKNFSQGINLKNIEIDFKANEEKLIITKLSINSGAESKNALGHGFIEFNKNINKFIPFLNMNLKLNKLEIVNNSNFSSSATGKLCFNGFLSGISEKPIITGDLILNDFVVSVNTEKKVNNLYKIDCILKKKQTITEISGNLKKRKSLIKRFLMDISLRLDDDAKIIGNNNLYLFLCGDANVFGEVLNPYLIGKIMVNNKKKNNNYNFLGNKLKINGGTIIYDSIEKNNPILDVSAKTLIGSEIISCSLIGRMNNVKIHFSSNMNKSEKEIISLLIFKSGLKDLSNDQTRIVNSFSLSMLNGNNTFGILNKIKESIGIDSIEFFKTENLKSGELKQNFRIGKNLNKKFKIFVDSSIGEKKNNKVTARYELMNNIGVETSIGTDKKESRVGIQFMKDY